MGDMWLRREDSAVKAKFRGITVQDANAPTTGRPVAVRFVDPEIEFANLTYPVILIERKSILKADEREHRGYAALTYWPEGNGALDDSRITPATAPRINYPIPLDVLYQITAMSRRADHQSQLAVTMFNQMNRFGFVTVPEDNTVRYMQLDGGPEFESIKDKDGKRTFRTHYMIRIPTEAPPMVPVTTPVSTVVTNLTINQQQ